MPWNVLADLAAVVELVAPSSCAGCGRVATRWCDGCDRELRSGHPRRWWPTPCPPGLPPTWTGPAYDGVVRAAVVAWKEEDRVHLTGILAPVLQGVLASALDASPSHRRAAGAGAPLLLVPAPSAPASVRARGRRAVSDLAVAATRRSVVVDALRLSRRVRDQAGLDAAARADNLAGAMRVPTQHRARLAGVPCVIVDDVVTTGATLQECARALSRAGSGPVVAVTLAATVRRR